MKHMERIQPGFVVFVYVSCKIVVCNVEVYFPHYKKQFYKPHYKSTNYTYKWHVYCFMKKATGRGISSGARWLTSALSHGAAGKEHAEPAEIAALCFWVGEPVVSADMPLCDPPLPLNDTTGDLHGGWPLKVGRRSPGMTHNVEPCSSISRSSWAREKLADIVCRQKWSGWASRQSGGGEGRAGRIWKGMCLVGKGSGKWLLIKIPLQLEVEYLLVTQ